MTTPDPDAQFDEFADLDSKLDTLFGEEPADPNVREMTQQFFKGTGDMKAWDTVDQSIHAAVAAQNAEHVDEEWGEFADTFFGEEESSPAATNSDPSFVANQTVRFDFGGDAAPSLASTGLGGNDTQEAATFNLFLKKIVNPKQRSAAVEIIAEILAISNDEAEAMTKKPFIKVLINVSKSEADAAHARFKTAGLISTIKKCV